MTLPMAIEYLNDHPKAGVWRDYEDCWISPEADNGQEEHAKITRETLDALRLTNVIGDNIYAGHKDYRRVYDVVPIKERSAFVRNEKTPIELLTGIATMLEGRRDARDGILYKKYTIYRKSASAGIGFFFQQPSWAVLSPERVPMKETFTSKVKAKKFISDTIKSQQPIDVLPALKGRDSFS